MPCRLPKIPNKQIRILDFDIECRPLSWYGGDFVTKEVTAIACRFLDEDFTHCWLLGETDLTTMLDSFRREYDMADMVTGHFIRGFDLPTLNSAYVEQGLPVLDSKLTQDTKLDLVKWSGLSKSQENIGAVLGLEHPKVGMNQATWRAANRLTPEGLQMVRERVIGDVQQHIEMRAVLLERGLLGPPKMWKSHSSGMGNYHP